VATSAPSTPPTASTTRPVRALPTDAAAWPVFVADLKLGGIVGQLAAHTELRRSDGRDVVLGLTEAHRHLADRAYADKLKAALDEATGRNLRLTFEESGAGDASLAAQEKRERALQKASTEAAFRDEPFVRDVLERFAARIRPDSIKPIS
jgi:DNA polymerase-3 subunit gamma/tau